MACQDSCHQTCAAFQGDRFDQCHQPEIARATRARTADQQANDVCGNSSFGRRRSGAEDGNHANAAPQRRRNFHPGVVPGIVDPAQSRFIGQRRPVAADDDQHDLQSGGSMPSQQVAGDEAVDIHDTRRPQL
jgi:hypothetical protein